MREHIDLYFPFSGVDTERALKGLLWAWEGVFDVVAHGCLEGFSPCGDLHTRDSADTLKCTTITVVVFRGHSGTPE